MQQNTPQQALTLSLLNARITKAKAEFDTLIADRRMDLKTRAERLEAVAKNLSGLKTLRPAGTQINHIDGDKANNRADNLEYVTPSRNVRHSLDVLGVQRAKGERNGMASLTDEQAQQIRMMYKTGRYKQVELARMFNTSPTVIGRLLLRKTWRHID